MIVFRSSHPEVFLRKGVLKICSKFTRERPCRSAISIKLQSNFIEITLRHRCSPVNLLHIFRTPFSKNTSGRLLLSLKDPLILYHQNLYCPYFSSNLEQVLIRFAEYQNPSCSHISREKESL